MTHSGVLEYPLSIEQEYLRVLDQLDAESIVHNRCFALRIRGSARLELVERTLEMIAARHEPLRTRFVVRDGGFPVQVVAPAEPLRLDVVDVDGPEAARIIVREEFRRPFDLAAGPPLRLRVLRLGPDDHVLVTSVHHMNFDGWSESVFLSELSEIYEALAMDRMPDLAPVAPTYGDHAALSRAKIEDGRFDEELDYWAGRLAEPRASLEMPTDFPRPAIARRLGARAPFRFPAELRRALEALGRSERATSFATLVAILGTLLNRYTGEEDVIIGTHVAGRHGVNQESLIGLFANTLALRIDLSGSPTFRALLVRVRDSVLAALSRQRAPFGEVVKRLNPERRSGRVPLFSVSFQWRNFPLGLHSPRGLRFERFDVDPGVSKTDLAIETWPHPEGIAGAAEYDTDLFERPTIERMLGHYRRLAESAVADPDRPISSLAILSDDERRSVVALWRGPETDYRPESPVHEIVEEEAARRPNATAIVDGERRISYAEMNALANRLAHRLIALGASPRSPVAVMLDRTAEFVVAALAIVKAGAFYVPLDRNWPPSRVRLILEDTETEIVVTSTDAQVSDLEDVARLVRFDASESAAGSDGSDESPGIATSGTDPIYVMYTSGSTGRPKGVIIEHRAVNRLVINTDFVTIRPGDVIAACASVAFDGATFEIWGALTSGATIVVVPQSTLLSPADLEALLHREKVSILFLTTSLARFLVRERPAAFRSVRALLVGGEAVDRSFRTAFAPENRPSRLVDAYGPTEATVFAVAGEIENDPSDRRLVPIGRPIANSIAGILDARGEPVPIGVPGEICLGGPGLAKGYLRDPVRTDEKFIPDLFTGEPDARLYRTGDRGRFRNDGMIEYLGRLDQQVKIRGYRIEPEEIEAILSSHPDVERAIVAPLGSAAGQRIVAWAKLRREIDPASLRSFLRETLPEFMIPSRIVPVDHVPLTRVGKLDFAALPLPPQTSVSSRPWNETEARVAEVWKEVLERDDAVVDMDFFDAGGDSLAALRLLATLSQRFGKEVRIERFFMQPTIEAVASWLATAPVTEASDPTIVPIHVGGRGTEAFLIPGGGGAEQEIFVLAPFFRMLSVERPIHGFRSLWLLDGQWDAARLIDRHTEELLAARPDPPWILLGECVGGILAWEVAARLESKRPGSTRLVLLDTRYPDSERLKRFERQVVRPATTRERILHHAKALRRGRLPKLTRVLNVIRGIEPLDDAGAALHRQRYARFLMGIQPTARDGETFFVVSEDSRIIDDVPRWQRLSSGPSHLVTVPGDHRTYLRASAARTALALDEILGGV